MNNDWTIKITQPGKGAENGGKLDFVVGLRNDLAAAANHKLAVDYKVTDDSAKLGTNYRELHRRHRGVGDVHLCRRRHRRAYPDTASSTTTSTALTGAKVTLSNPVGAKLASGSDQAQVGTITEHRHRAANSSMSDCAAPVKQGTDIPSSCPFARPRSAN